MHKDDVVGYALLAKQATATSAIVPESAVE
jgi:hypothetical protein